MRRFIPILIAAVLAGGCKSKASSETPAAPAPAPIAVVNGVSIDAKAFEDEVAKITQGGARSIPEERLAKIRENIVNRLVEEELLRQESKRQGVSVTDADVETEFAKYRARFKGDEQFQGYLTHGHTSVDEIKARLRENLGVTRLLEKMGKLTVSDADIQQAYEAGKKMFTEPEQVHAKHLLFRLADNATEAQIDKMKDQKSKEIKAAGIAAGFTTTLAAWSVLVKKFSEDPLTKERDGDLGWIRKGVMGADFDRLFEKEPGFVDWVRTSAGLHMVMLVEKKPERVKPMEEVRDQIRESLVNRNQFKARRELVEQLKASAKVEIPAK